jgi:hypothetical protein
MDLAPAWFGSIYDFWHYLDGDSEVRPRSREEVWAWLVECEKKPDLALFGERDYWQHPVTFEQLRMGDCEDHALWAWRKLGELGISARFFIGQWQWNGEMGAESHKHAWVTFQDEDGEYLVESMAGSVGDMVQPLERAKPEYTPHMSIGHFKDTRIYGGFVQYRRWLKKNRGRLWSGDPYRPLGGGQLSGQSDPEQS